MTDVKVRGRKLYRAICSRAVPPAPVPAPSARTNVRICAGRAGSQLESHLKWWSSISWPLPCRPNRPSWRRHLTPGAQRRLTGPVTTRTLTMSPRLQLTSTHPTQPSLPAPRMRPPRRPTPQRRWMTMAWYVTSRPPSSLSRAPLSPPHLLFVLGCGCFYFRASISTRSPCCQCFPPKRA